MRGVKGKLKENNEGIEDFILVKNKFHLTGMCNGIILNLVK